MSLRDESTTTQPPDEAWCAPVNQEIEVELYPGARVRVKVPDTIPQYATMALVKNPATGTYQLTPCVWAQHVRMTEDLAARLGLGVSTSVFYRLLSTGFVKSSEFGPRTLLVDLISVLKHLHRTRRQPGKKSWWTPERKDLWNATRCGIGSLIEREEMIKEDGAE
jgi:hypothetical protein